MGMLPAPAKVQPACVSGLLIGSIAAAGSYSCRLDAVTYGFNSSMVELDSGVSALNFNALPDRKSITFTDELRSHVTFFSYQVKYLTLSMENLQHSHTQDRPDILPECYSVTFNSGAAPFALPPSSLPRLRTH